ncbi:hypothetical protein H2136_23875 [Aeromonas hydrophila]|uniref:Uncharacterized protein n=1 Tax=Aeromonas hydrophila TaxID=644 RepID=A0A926FNV7_AERHY|nr:hypothetical protein [Aeromonas hydrophila]MBC8674492.1 hypothetical protein [Aeromonas hydrophila]
MDNSNDNNLISLANGKVLLSATVTVVDGDNDTATGTVSADLVATSASRMTYRA